MGNEKNNKRFTIPKGATAFTLGWDENEDQAIVDFETGKEPDDDPSNKPVEKKGGLKSWLTGKDE